MTNKDLAKIFKKAASLLELHGANNFKVGAYAKAVNLVEQMDFPVAEAEEETLKGKGFTKGIIEKVDLIKETESFPELDELLEKTPEGVVLMLDIKGIGAKKVAAIWQELEIESLEDLKKACEEKKVQKLKGFGAKTELTILEQIEFLNQAKGFLHCSDAAEISENIVQKLKELGAQKAEEVGELRRKNDVVSTLTFLIVSHDKISFRKKLEEEEFWSYDLTQSGPYVSRGLYLETSTPIEFHFTTEDQFISRYFQLTAHPDHLGIFSEEQKKSLSQIVAAENFTSEEAIYEKADMPFFPAETREGYIEQAYIEKKESPNLVQYEDLKGILHNHTTYSDGANTLREMAEYCKELGYEYVGITDHSKSAFYARGLSEEQIIEQHQEIDALNEELKPFKIFKGIESDILSDGSLDYSDEVLKSFDFIVASIHSGLKMDKEKATQRLLNAIANPFTTILGHPTGRLLLKREGYPIDHQAVIDACAEHNVIIEINANPWRLDLDWRWVHYAIQKGVKISINPDAHKKEGYHDMRYGWWIGKKGGLSKEMTFNALTVEEMENSLRS